MAKIIVSCRYRKNPKGIANLVRYIGTREGVEKLPSTNRYEFASKSQMQLVQTVAKKFPASKRFLEYEDYDRLPTKENATEYLNAVAERYADRVGELKTLVRYISERPGVERVGSHGLFTQLDVPIDIDEVAERIANHDGIVWQEVISLRREDAERLHYNNAAAWRDLVRRNMNEIALAHRIKVEDLRWYGAFHNTTHHPHIHLIVYSGGQEGYLSEKGIHDLRRAFGQDIFRGEQYKLASIETGFRNEIRSKMDELLEQVNSRESIPNLDYYLRLLMKVKEEVNDSKGKKLYGYLPSNTKQFIDFALREFAKDDCIRQLYKQWLRANREKLSLYYDPKDNDPGVPIEKNPEFRSLKNIIIKTALSIDFSVVNTVDTVRVGFLFSLLAKQISAATQRKLNVLSSRMPLADSKEQEKIAEKKRALGQKIGGGYEKEEEETYDSMAVDAILSGLDMLLDELERKSAEEEQQKLLAQTDIDQAFDDYRDGEDSGFDDEHNEEYDEDRSSDNDDFDEDYDENEDDGFVISM